MILVQFAGRTVQAIAGGLESITFVIAPNLFVADDPAVVEAVGTLAVRARITEHV